MQLDSANFSESNGRLVMGFSIGSQETREKKKKKINKYCSTGVSRMVTQKKKRSCCYQLKNSLSDGKRCFLVDMAATDSLTETQVI